MNLNRKENDRFLCAAAAADELLCRKKNGVILIAVDGKCGSGKSTLGAYLQQKFDANLFHTDDFFLQDEQRTPARLAETGGNVDYERFYREVLIPVTENREVCYRRFDCSVRQLCDGIVIPPRRVNIVEGSYSCHPYFGEPYDLKIFMEINETQQLQNIAARSGADKLELFQKVWIPKENQYFKQFQIKENSHMVISWQ